jgi:hypothetical protein
MRHSNPAQIAHALTPARLRRFTRGTTTVTAARETWAVSLEPLDADTAAGSSRAPSAPLPWTDDAPRHASESRRTLVEAGFYAELVRSETLRPLSRVAKAGLLFEAEVRAVCEPLPCSRRSRRSDWTPSGLCTRSGDEFAAASRSREDEAACWET